VEDHIPTQPQPQAPQPSLIQLTRPEQRTLQTQSPVSTLLNGPSGRAHNVFSRLRPFVSSPCPTGAGVSIPPAPPASPPPVSGRFPRPVGPLGSSVQDGSGFPRGSAQEVVSSRSRIPSPGRQRKMCLHGGSVLERDIEQVPGSSAPGLKRPSMVSLPAHGLARIPIGISVRKEGQL